MSGTTSWTCPAYGPEGVRVGAVCFFGRPGERSCLSEIQCRLSLSAERDRVWTRINELADAGEQEFVFLRKSIGGPDELLGGTT